MRTDVSKSISLSSIRVWVDEVSNALLLLVVLFAGEGDRSSKPLRPVIVVDVELLDDKDDSDLA